MDFTASCLFGLEKLVGEDIDNLGLTRKNTIDGHVTFSGDISAAAECNINFRYAERLYINAGEFRAATFDELFEGTKAIDWAEYIGSADEFPVKGHCVRSKLFSVPDCQRIIKKAVADSLCSAYKTKTLPETGNKIQIVFFIFNDTASLMIDTSGDALYKRGYRQMSVAAPLRETLAAAMVKLSRPREGVILCDPFCGSGTIPIEAALLCTNTAPGLKRRFAGEKMPFIPAKAWERAREKAKDSIIRRETPIFGSDIDKSSVELSEQNAKLAGVNGIVSFAKADARHFASPVQGARGTIVTNPPYGERLGEKEEMFVLYKEFGKAIRENVPMWQLYILNSNPDFPIYFGKKPDKVRKLYNGMIKCGLFQYFKNNI